MITIRKSSERGHGQHGWLDTFHSFSFGDYHDPRHMHFRALRVLNEDVVAPARGFGRHPHDNMEILTFVLSGELAHTDSLGSQRTLRHGEVQRMSAGTGIEHAEFNPSKTTPVHLLQVWILPDKKGEEPAYDQKEFAASERTNALRLVASPGGENGSLTLGADARAFVAEVDAGKSVTLDLKPKRHAWVQVAKGGVTVNGAALAQGDGAAISDERSVTIVAKEPAEVVVFDLA